MQPTYWQEAKIYLSDSDNVMATIIEKYDGESLQKRNDAFTTLARSITGQQISVKAASSIWNKMEMAIGEVTPSAILFADEETLRSSGYSGQKTSYLKDIARNFTSGEFNPEQLINMEEEQAIAELIKLKGVGRWTAEMFLIFYMLKPDIYPIDDIGLQKAIKLHYLNPSLRGGKSDEAIQDKKAGSPRSQKLTRDDEIKAMLKLSEIWRPYRTVATWYLWRSLDPEPVEY